MRTATIPTFYCPIESDISEHAAAAQAHNLKWTIDFELLPAHGSKYNHFVASKFANLSARTFPDATLKDLELILDFSSWLFLRDDGYDNAKKTPTPDEGLKVDNHLLQILQGRSVEPWEPPSYQALEDIYHRLVQRADRPWMQRFILSMAQYFQGNYWETLNHASGLVPDLSTYIKVRQFSSAVYPSFDFILLVQEIRPTAAFLKHIFIQQMTVMANNYVCWANDIFGVEKESKEGNTSNLVFVLQNEHKINLDEAIGRVAQMCDAEMKAFLSLQERLPFFGREQPEALRYVRNLRSWMRGNMDWSYETKRY